MALFLAFVGPWVANALWNASAKHLPMAISGQMIVFETICALLYGYLLAWQLPNEAEAFGILLILSGIFWTIRAEGRGALRVAQAKARERQKRCAEGLC